MGWGKGRVQGRQGKGVGFHIQGWIAINMRIYVVYI
jgi:hypothetical protein